MDLKIEPQLAEFVLEMGDDELVLGHRNSEWCGHAPILEEDIAFANIALDELGHARLWYEIHAALVGKDPETYPDKLAYFREAADFRSVPLVALPNGDWAFTIVRQYIFDLYEKTLLAGLLSSKYEAVAQVAAKITPEEIYHLRHIRAWVKRLGLGTSESNRRMQTALNELAGYIQPLFEPSPARTALAEAGIIPDMKALFTAWLKEFSADVDGSGLQMPSIQPKSTGRGGLDSHLVELVNVMQEVARLDPKANW